MTQGAITTPRLLLRCWEPRDAPLLKDAIDSSLPELQQWMPWATSEPSPVGSLAERIGKFRRAFQSGHDWTYGIFDPGETLVLGGAGLHQRTEPGRLEIGYWIRSSAAGAGLATEAAAALVDVAFRVHHVEAVEIRCDLANERSAAVPRRLGFQHVETLVGDRHGRDGTLHDTMVWQLTAPLAAWPT
jgi:RimJ/RimL family protein N-acetyltransferase